MNESARVSLRYVDGRSGPVFPTIPAAASVTWNGVVLEHHRAPAMELEQHDIPEHHLIVRLGSTLKLTWKEGGAERSKLLLPGTASIYPAGPVARCYWKEHSELLLFSFPREFWVDIAGTDKPLELRACRGMEDGLILELARALNDCSRWSPSTSLYAETLVAALGSHLLHTYAVSSKPVLNIPALSARRMGTLIDYLHAQLETRIELSRLAAIVGLSAQYVGKLFKQTTGISIHEYVARERIVRARELLRDSSLSINTVALRLGFADQSHFSRVFRRITRLSPAKYRSQL
ncbi:MAG: helix-turn-helix transcriptional regulator [Acidobacteriaceae bacterium]|nr:helix-turn-helix transcriptional regulator [Acidobacteriaceae bacterium]